jgi:hypothetical protein
VLAAALALPTESTTPPAGTLTTIVPAASAVGVTTSVALVPLMRLKAPLVPLVTVMSSAVKLVPTSRLKLKLKVTGPVATVSAALLVMVTTGALVGTTAASSCGGALPLPPPQAARINDRATAAVAAHLRDEGDTEGKGRCCMASGPGEWAGRAPKAAWAARGKATSSSVMKALSQVCAGGSRLGKCEPPLVFP